MSMSADLHPAPEERPRDWDEPANRDQLQTPSDGADPFLDAARQYAEANGYELEDAIRVLLAAAEFVRQHPPTWLR